MNTARKKIRFKKNQNVFVLGEDDIKEYKLNSTYYEDDFAIVIQPDDDDSFWVEGWQVAATREELVEQIHEYAEEKIVELNMQIRALEDWKEKYK